MTPSSPPHCFDRAALPVLATSSYTPCLSQTGDNHTHCCATGTTCLSNGLCFSSWDASLNVGACTDPSWTSPACFQHCPVGAGAFSTLYRCDDNEWCCSRGANTTSCCEDGDESEMVRLMGFGRALVQSGGTGFVEGWRMVEDNGSASGWDASNSAAGAMNASASSWPEDASSSRLNVGLGAGLGVGIPLLVVVAVLAFLLRREKRLCRELEERYAAPGAVGLLKRQSPEDRPSVPECHQNAPNVMEVPSSGTAVQRRGRELMGNDRAELPSHS